jgi:nucleoside-diphosphate-sugar epimerase
VRVLITGASSSLGGDVLRRLLKDTDFEFWCARHKKEIPLIDPRLNVVDLDLESDFSGNLSNVRFDLVVHFAGLTHASDEREYWSVNVEGTDRLARVTHEDGCRRFVYISTRCATEGSGAYGESKLAAEQALQKLQWQSLLIIRPSEIYGGQGNEGIDRMLSVASRWRIVPALFGDPNLTFAPLHIEDFSKRAVELIREPFHGVRIENTCGPEDLKGTTLAWRISRHYSAVPLPLWWPATAICLKTLQQLGFDIVKPDQLKRLVGPKTAGAEINEAQRAGMRRFLSS